MRHDSPLSRCLDFFIHHKIVTLVLALALALWGIYHAPFNWRIPGLERDPVPVDAIPDVGENQQIVFVDWMGHSAADLENLVTQPLAATLMATPGARIVRGSSMAGMASVYVIFDENMPFHDARARILEKLASLPQNLLPPDAKPALGPDASPLGQVFWYTLDGIDARTGKRIGGWDLVELREIQDRWIAPALASAHGIAEIAAAAHGAVEYRIDLDPDKMTAHRVTMPRIYAALEKTGGDNGAGTFEINGVEYYIRVLGALRSSRDIENTVVAAGPDGPVRIRDLGSVRKTLAGNGGGLDRFGHKAVGAVAVARQGENPMAAIAALKEKIAEIAPSLPEKILPDGSVSKATVIPFYDRSKLIGETLLTLTSAIRQQILITIVVIVLMLANIRAGIMVSLLMPLSVLICFILMRRFGIDANLVSLSGIAIAVGTISDMGIILSENIATRLKKPEPGETPDASVLIASNEVGGAVLTAVATTIVGFLPVFALTGPEGKLFKPLAYTKTFCLFAAIVVTLLVLPALAHFWLAPDPDAASRRKRYAKALAGAAAAFLFGWYGYWIVAAACVAYALWRLAGRLASERTAALVGRAAAVAAALAFGFVLAEDWQPLGIGAPIAHSVLFVWLLILAVYGAMELFIYLYPVFLSFCLRFKALFLVLPLCLCLLGACVWLGFNRVLGFVPAAADRAGLNGDRIRSWGPWVELAHAFPGLGKEFMPSFDEGAFLYMPTVMSHAAISEVESLINLQDMRFDQVPEVIEAVGKYGRAESALDPAPASMFETIINYETEYMQDAAGRVLTFAYNPDREDVFRNRDGKVVLDDGKAIPVRGTFRRNGNGALIPDPHGQPFRQWRPRLKTIDDLWREIAKAGEIPGITGAPRLYPIEARMVMLQTGIRAPMGIKIQGSSLEDIQRTAEDLEKLLRKAPLVNAGAVAADRSLGRPYWEVVPNRDALAKHGIPMYNFEHFLEVAIAGTMTPNWVYEDRSRTPVRPTLEKKFRSGPDELAVLRVPTPDGKEVPLGEVAEFRFTQGPEMIASEGSRLTAYVVFDRNPGVAEVEAVEAARDYLRECRARGEFAPPPGVTYSFTGSYENQVRSEKVFAVILPAALAAIFLIIYMQFRSTAVSLILFAGVPLSLAGGMILLWLYGRGWFLGHELFGIDLRELLHVRAYNLSVAVWVGFLALFGIATDDGVVMATYLEQSVAANRPTDVAAARAAVIQAGLRRVRPCLMTTATTMLALLPVLTSAGRGAEIMIPMAIPSFGGMLLVIITMFVVPVCYCWLLERRCR